MNKFDCIYLDYNATAPILPAVADCMAEAMKRHPSNASSMHRYGQQAKKLMTHSRQILASHIDCPPEYIIFTSGGTEANNMALKGYDWDHVILSSIEHDSIFKSHLNPTLIPVDSQGLVNTEELKKELEKIQGKILVSIIYANNETGVIQPIREIADIVHHYGGLLHIDAAQVLGKIPFSFKETRADMATLCFHKIGGPIGVGALVVKESVPLSALLNGGGQERNRRSGTENIPAILGIEETLKSICFDEMNKRQKWHLEMETAMENLLKEHGDTPYIFSKKANRLPNITTIALPGMENVTQVINLDLAGFAVSMGSACSSGRVKKISRPLQGICQNDVLAQSSIRISTGWDTKETDLRDFFNAWKKLYLLSKKKVKDDTAA